MDGIERLEEETKKINNPSITKIFEFLKTRENLYEHFKNEEKTMKKMYKYICNKASNHRVGNVAVVDDNLVYIWSVSYFSKTDEELGIKEEKVMPPSPMENLKKIEEKKAKEQKKKDENAQMNLFEEVQK